MTNILFNKDEIELLENLCCNEEYRNDDDITEVLKQYETDDEEGFKNDSENIRLERRQKLLNQVGRKLSDAFYKLSQTEKEEEEQPDKGEISCGKIEWNNYIIMEIRYNDNKKWLVKHCRDKGIKQSRWCRYNNLVGKPESKTLNKNTLKLNIFRYYVGREPYEEEQIRMKMTGLSAVEYFIN